MVQITNKANLNDWDYIREEFHKQYMYNTQLPIGLRELELTKQNSNEDFVTLLNRWREKATQITNRPSQEDQVRLVICNLQSMYGDHIKFQPIESFTKLYKVGLLIREEVYANKNKGSNNNSFKKSNNNNPSSSNVNALTTYSRCYQGPQRTFTSLGLTLKAAFTRFHAKGALQAIDPTPGPPCEKRSSKWNLNAYYKYHQGNGHTTSQCWTLKHHL